MKIKLIVILALYLWVLGLGACVKKRPVEDTTVVPKETPRQGQPEAEKVAGKTSPCRSYLPALFGNLEELNVEYQCRTRRDGAGTVFTIGEIGGNK